MNVAPQIQHPSMGCTVHLNRHNSLTFRIYYKGREFWEGIGAPGNAENRRLAEAHAVIISAEIARKTFDYLKWFPKGNKAHLFRDERDRAERKTLRAYYNEWIEGKQPPVKKKSAYRNYKGHFDNHLLPRRGDKYLDSFGVKDIREILTELVDPKGKKLEVKTATNILNASMRALFRDAKADGYIEHTPFDDLPEDFWPDSVKPDPDPFFEHERDAITEYFFNKYARKWLSGAVFCYAQFWVGTRPSEMTARRWKDLDPRTGKLSITTSRTEGEEGVPKTTGSRRTIELFPKVLEYILQMRPLRAQPDDYIFTDTRGNPINHWKYGEHQFQGALTALGDIRPRAFKFTRHTFISVMLLHGENPKQIADYVGNSPQVIFTKYAKWIGGQGTFGQAAMGAAGADLKKARDG